MLRWSRAGVRQAAITATYPVIWWLALPATTALQGPPLGMLLLIRAGK